ncbi:MAG: class I SAM-dependent methyltransferase [Armatimonadetes bacterium]|nr:class I SAM-dependent methyltransferase [Armatimonadota bacterium]
MSIKRRVKRIYRSIGGIPASVTWSLVGGYGGLTRLRKLCFRHMLAKFVAGDHTWFDHRLDELNWPNNLFWCERGVLGTMNLAPGDIAMDCCCGDGYFSRIFWSPITAHIDAVDRDACAVDMARKLACRGKVDFHVMDILVDTFPRSSYDAVFLFEAIEHLSVDDGHRVLEKIRGSLNTGGKLVGSTVQVDSAERGTYNREHDNEFETATHLQEFLRATFDDVSVVSTVHPERTTLYFVCRKTAD